MGGKKNSWFKTWILVSLLKKNTEKISVVEGSKRCIHDVTQFPPATEQDVPKGGDIWRDCVRVRLI